MFRVLSLSAVVVSVVSFAVPAYPHSGGLDSNGGHHDRKNGGYHIHRPRNTSTTTPPSSFSSPTTKRAKQEKKPRPIKPKGRAWIDRDGRHLAKGDPTNFDKTTCEITIADGVHPAEAISLENLSVLDQAFTLDDFKRRSKYKSHLVKWTSKGGVHHVFATPLVVDDQSVRLRKTDGRVIDVPLKHLDDVSQQLAHDLRQAGEAAKELIDSIEPNPFAVGRQADTTATSRSVATTSDAPR